MKRVDIKRANEIISIIDELGNECEFLQSMLDNEVEVVKLEKVGSISFAFKAEKNNISVKFPIQITDIIEHNNKQIERLENELEKL